ncbi:MAG: acetate--CoA ligase [Dehalococcoidia bacterium]|nr:acetate--CoA ligase [Dehalococcoidia bacterium]
MNWPPIRKPPGTLRVAPNLGDYATAVASFSWDDARRELLGDPPGNINIAYLAVDRHVAAGRGDRIAIRWLGRKGERRNLTYQDLKLASDSFANVLRDLEVGPGDTVFALSERVPELYIAAIGTLKNRSVFCPLFPAFGPEPIHQRMSIGCGKLLVTTPMLYKRKVAQIRASLPDLQHVILIGEIGDLIEEAHGFDSVISIASDQFTIPETAPEDLALLHFTSGTTGKPKGAMHVHDAVVAHYITGKTALDFHESDIFWCTADPGWVTGTSYGIISPLTHGLTMVVDQADFDAARWYRILQDERVTVWYTAPTAIRMLMKAGPGLPRGFDLSALRFAGSVGEPLNPEGVAWGAEVLGLPIHDNWWQTETGGIMIANYAAMDIRPGSMGKPLPGIEAAVVRHEDDAVTVIEAPGEEGELALRAGWPSMFRGYLGEEERYRKCFSGEWYLTGDLARVDEDGYFWFVGRADDVIKSAGHLIGPFEVESAIMEHPAVAEVGVIGKPDPVAGEIVKAFVALKPGFEPGEDLRLDILGFARKRLGTAVAPKEIVFTEDLPRTRSGKIMRRLLKARELGLPEGDLSTLEGPA